MNLIQKLKFFRDLAAKVKELDVAGKLDQAADIADQVEQALRYAADLCREYLGVPTVGHDGNGELAAELTGTEQALIEAFPARSAGALNPAVLPVVFQLLIELVRLSREKHKV